MASKATTNRKTVAKGLTTKYVKKAKMWVATYPKEGKTLQTWFDKEPTGDELNKIKESLV